MKCPECYEEHEDQNHIFSYVEDVPEEYNCTICLHPLQQPMDTPCGHTFCAVCIEPSIRVKKLCPNCRKQLILSDLRPSTFLVRNMLNKLRVECPVCKEPLARQSLSVHLTTLCQHLEVDCKYKGNGCKVQMPRQLIEEHNEACEFKDKPVLEPTGILENTETLVEIVRKPRDRLGLTIYGGSDTNVSAIVIQEVIRNGICHRDQRLRIGDHILEVNGRSLRSVTHRQAFSLLDKASSPISLLILRPSLKTNISNPIPELVLEPQMVELVKEPGDELGIRIMSSPRENGVKVLNLIDGSIASRSDRIRQSDRLLSINGVSLVNVSQQNAADIIKRQTGVIKFLVQRSICPSDGAKLLSPYLTSLVSFKPALIQLDAPLHTTTLTLTFEADAHDLLGFSVVGGMGSVLGDIPVFVVHVNENSNAFNAGVQVGDMVIRINSQHLLDQSAQSVLALLKNLNADQLTLTIQRIELDNPVTTQFCSDWPFNLPSKGFGKLTSVRISRPDAAASLGFRIVGGEGSPQGDLPIVIKSISNRSLASKSALRPGDHVLACNGVSLISTSHENAAAQIKNTRGDVRLTVISWPHVETGHHKKPARHRSLENLVREDADS